MYLNLANKSFHQSAMFNRILIKFNGHHLAIATMYWGQKHIYAHQTKHCVCAQHASNYYYFVRSLNLYWIVLFCIIFWMLIRVKSTNFSVSVFCSFPLNKLANSMLSTLLVYHQINLKYMLLFLSRRQSYNMVHAYMNGWMNEWMWKVWSHVYFLPQKFEVLHGFLFTKWSFSSL